MNWTDLESSHQLIKTEKMKQKVLVIDDNVDTLLLHKTVLELEGFEVFTAQCGSDAFAILKKISFPQLILLDMKMDEMSGLEFINKLEKERPEIVESVPVVFMSGVDQTPISRAAGFIKKPIDIGYFVQAVRRFINAATVSPIKQ
jgi:CheY-like chemotaxis protein